MLVVSARNTSIATKGTSGGLIHLAVYRRRFAARSRYGRPLAAFRSAAFMDWSVSKLSTAGEATEHARGPRKARTTTAAPGRHPQ